MNQYINIATKVNPYAYQALQKICAKRGISLYDMLQMVCDTLVRYMSDKTNLSEDIEKAVSIFEHMEGWRDAYNLADPAADTIADKALYFVGDGRKKGFRAVMMQRPFMGVWKQNTNVQEIIEQVMNMMFPSLYKRLRRVGSDEECTNVLETIDMLCRMHEKDGDVKAIRDEFEDCNRSDYGAKPSDVQYKRKMHKDIDAPDIQRTILFEEGDGPTQEEIDNEPL